MFWLKTVKINTVSETSEAGLLYHGTIPDSGQRSNVRMADDEVLKTVSLRRKI